jgi:hypothetical protein
MNPPGQPPLGEMPMKPTKPSKPMPPQGETNPPGQPPQGEMPMKPRKPMPPQGEMNPTGQPPQGEMPMKPGKPMPPQGEVNPPPQAPDAPRTGEFVPPRPMGPMPELPQHDPALDAAMQNSDNQRANSIADVQRDRRTIRGADGSQMIVEPGGRVIIVNGDTAIIRHNDYDRLDTGARNVESRPTADGGRVVVVYRPDGARIRTVYDRWGGVLQRTREDPDGRSYVLFDNRLPPPGAVADYPNGPMGQPVVVLPPPVYDLPPEQYRVDLRTAPPAYVVDALTAPPIVPVEPCVRSISTPSPSIPAHGPWTRARRPPSRRWPTASTRHCRVTPTRCSSLRATPTPSARRSIICRCRTGAPKRWPAC